MTEIITLCLGVFCIGGYIGGKLQRFLDADYLLRCRTIPEAYLRITGKPIDFTMWRIFTQEEDLTPHEGERNAR